VSPTVAYARLRTSFAPHAALLSNSTSLIATSVVTSGFGFVFWWLAAREASPTSVGRASAAVAAMTFVGTIAAAGLGTLLISELPGQRRERWRLVSACLAVASVVALAGGVVVTLTFLRWLDVIAAAAVIAGVIVTAGTLVLDEALIGMLVGRIQLIRNAVFAGGKLALLAACAVAPFAVSATVIVDTWVLAAVVSLGAVVIAVRRRGIGGSLRPDFARLRSVRGRAMDHNRLNLALFLPRAALPLIVTVCVSARDNAGFYAAWMIVTVLAMIPMHFATTLFAVASDPAALPAKLRVAIGVSLAAGVPLSVLIAVERDRLMALFGPDYVALGAAALGILAAAYVPMMVRQFYIAVSRVTGRIRRATTVALIAGTAEIGAAVWGGLTGGVTRLAVALLVVTVAEALVMAPAVIRATR
jgi:O-antigen/teichoic acid export membrane protein